MLSDTQIKALQPEDKRYRVSDGNGLYILVRTNGKKVFVMRYQIAKKRYDRQLGYYPALTLQKARAIVADAQQSILAGNDPFKIDRDRSKANFGKVANLYLAEKLKGKSPSYQKKLKLLNNKYLQLLGDKTLVDVTTDDIRALLLAISSRGINETAQRVQWMINDMYRWAILRDYCEHNPASILQGLIPTHRVKHYAHIENSALLGQLLRDIDLDIKHGRRSFSVGFALQLLPHLFVRPHNLRKARVEEFDLQDRMWKIPAARMKMREPHWVPLSRQVMKILEQALPFARDGYLLPGSKNAHILTAQSINNAIKDLGYGSDVITPHGFRGTASTLLNERGWDERVIEKQLAHQEKNQVKAAYNHAKYMAQRREMMQTWSDILDECRDRAGKV